jgi:hypothetical protein
MHDETLALHAGFDAEFDQARAATIRSRITVAP